MIVELALNGRIIIDVALLFVKILILYTLDNYGTTPRLI